MANEIRNIRDLEETLGNALEAAANSFGVNISTLGDRLTAAVNLNEIRLEFAINAEEPTTASVENDQTDLPTISVQVDPSGISSIFPNMMDKLISINSITSSNTESSRNKILYNSLTNALRILINRNSYKTVITEFNVALVDNGIQRIDEAYREMVRNAMADIIKDLSKYGPEEIPYPDYEIIVKEDLENVPENVVIRIPDGYTIKYKKYIEDEFKGYQEWVSKDKTDSVFFPRAINSRYFENLQEDTYGTAELNLVDALIPYMDSEELQLTPEIINQILSEESVSIKNNANEKALGSGSSSSPDALKALLGYIASSIDVQAEIQLPVSVLNVSSIQQSMQRFSENMASIRNINQLLDEAMQLPSAIEDLVNVNIGNILSNIGLDEALSQLNVNLNVNLGNLGEVGSAIQQIADVSSRLNAELQEIAQIPREIEIMLGNINVSLQ